MGNEGCSRWITRRFCTGVNEISLTLVLFRLTMDPSPVEPMFRTFCRLRWDLCEMVFCFFFFFNTIYKLIRVYLITVLIIDRSQSQIRTSSVCRIAAKETVRNTWRGGAASIFRWGLDENFSKKKRKKNEDEKRAVSSKRQRYELR